MTESYVGLCERVRYRRAIGFAYVDDGAGVRRIDGALFDRLRAAPLHDDGALAAFARAHATIFCGYARADDARASFDERAM